MGYFSCSAESAVAACDSYNWEELLTRDEKRPYAIAEFTFSDLSSATHGFCARNLLGKGSHGSVYRAQFNHRNINLIAAVKRTKQTATSADNEVEILSRVYHPRLVNLIGFGVDPSSRKLIVVEYMPNGSLYELLHGPGKQPGWIKRARFALQIAGALQFLHSSNPPIIHRDIKSSNVLIDSKFNSRISDFGLALRGNTEDVRLKSTPPAGTLGYLDPGYLSPADISTKSDVFSFGILLLEIISGRNAIDLNYSPPSVVEWAVPQIRSGNIAGIYDRRIVPPTDDDALRRMAVLAARCVRSTAEKRPAMEEVVTCLGKVYKSMRRMQKQKCINLGRRVENVMKVPRVSQDEELDSSMEVINPAKQTNRKLSSAELGYRVGRSKSAGAGVEKVFRPSDLSKSRSTGKLVSKRVHTI